MGRKTTLKGGGGTSIAKKGKKGDTSKTGLDGI